MSSRVRSGSTLLGFGLITAAMVACAAPSGSAPGAADSRPAAGHLGPTGAVLRTPGGEVVSDELVIEPGADVDDDAIRALAARAGAIEVSRAELSGIYVLRFADADTTAAASAMLREAPEIRRVEPSKVASGTGIATSPIIIPNRQWNLNALRLRGLPGGDPVWPVGGVRVAVLDSGAAYETFADAGGSYLRSPDLAGVPFAAGWDFVNGDAHPNDDHGHGTHIASTIGATSGARGIAPGVELMLVKVLDRHNLGTEAALAEGIRWAVDHGADVINMSLSFAPEYFPSAYLQGAIEYAARHSVVMVAAAGNNGAGVVTYPAAFRDVIAVGASRLRSSYSATPDGTWSDAAQSLRRAPYSNHGQRLDVVSPAGVLDADADHDGDPEGILARTFSGSPLALNYYVEVGTSQAAAEVSAVAAMMLAQNPALRASQVRSILGATALGDGSLLSSDIGRGHIRADLAIQAAAATAPAPVEGPKLSAAVSTTIHGLGAFRFARAEVEVLDEDGAPAAGVRVYGSFSGGFFAAQRLTADSSGRAVFYSSLLAPGTQAIGFQVDAVAVAGELERPRGAVRIDSCSLELLAKVVTNASGSGIATSPPGTGTSGSGIATSPGPVNMIRPTIHSSEVPSVALLNFAWGSSILPMSVAVDAAWFASHFPQATAVRVVSQGSGIATSPIVLPPGTGFAQAQSYSYPGGSASNCLPMVVKTFGAPTADVLAPKPGACAGACGAAVAALWTNAAAGSGIATSPGPIPGPPPVFNPNSGITLAQFTQLSAMAAAYAPFSKLPSAIAVADYGAVLGAAGVGMAPLTGGSSVDCADGDIACESPLDDGSVPSDDDSEMPDWALE